MNNFTRAYFIGGPRHGATQDLDGRPAHYRVAETNQSFGQKPYLSVRHGVYARTRPLTFDPINHKAFKTEPSCWFYEWQGYTS